MPDSLLPGERQAIIEWLTGMRDYFAASRPNIAAWANEKSGELEDEALRQKREADQLEEDVHGSAEFLGPDETVPPLTIQYAPPDDPLDDELDQMLERGPDDDDNNDDG